MRLEGLKRRAIIAEATAEIWRASTQPDRWADAIRILRPHFRNSQGGVIISPLLMGKPNMLWIAADPPPGLIEAYVSGEWHKKDILMHAILRRLPEENFAYTFDDLLPRAVLDNSPMYRDVARQFGMAEGAGVAVRGTGEEMVFLSMYGEHWTGTDKAEYRSIMQELLPHIEGAISVHWRMIRTERTADVSRYALDQLSLGIFWLAADGKIIEANKIARHMLDGRDGLADKSGILHAVEPHSASLLSKAIRKANSDSAEAHFQILRDGKPPLSIIVAPQQSDSSGAKSEIAALVFVTDPSAIARDAGERVGAMYGLSSAEIVVAQKLAEGMTLEAISQHRAVSITTTRTQLKSLMAKLGVTKQSDVVRAVLSVGMLQ